MIGGKRKTIGVFINKSDNYFDETVFHALQERAKLLNYDLLVFYTVGYRNSSNYYDTLESSMFDFAPIEKLDGILAVPDSYEMLDFRKKLLDMLAERATCPIVNIRYHVGPNDCVFTDETKALRPLIQHLIKDHGLTKIAFLAGYPGHPDSELRLQCYKEELEANGLSVPENGIFYGTMWYADADKAYEHFFADPNNIPQAIVCANDYMAHGLIHEIHKNGYSVPDDVIVTGFDNTQVISPYSLSLTTIGQDYTQMVELGLDQLDKRIREKTHGIPSKGPEFIGLHGNLFLGDTCGCRRQTTEAMLENARSSVFFTQNLKNREIGQTYFSIELNDCGNLSEMHDVLLKKLPDVPMQRDFYLCMFEIDNRKPDDPTYAGEITHTSRLVTAFKDRQDCGMPMISFDSSMILPSMAERPDEPQAFFIFLLHQGDNTFGYTAIQFQPGEIPSVFYQHWNVIIANALQNMRSQITLQRLYEERKLSSITDPLTGLYNRRGLEENLLPYWSQYCSDKVQICFIEIDMDELKSINDTWGHSSGDLAIKTLANIGRLRFPDNAIFARMGGDEFLAVIPYCSKQNGANLVSRISAELADTWPDPKRHFNIKFSAGVYSTILSENDLLEDCLRAADRLMYKEKQAHRAARQKAAEKPVK